MEHNKRPVSSFASDLFGFKDTPSSAAASSSSSGIFASIFAPSSKALARECVRSEAALGKKQYSAKEVWNAKLGVTGVNSALLADSNHQDTDGEGQSKSTREVSSLYQEERVQPCHLSSSIYYGGPDVYSCPQNDTQTSSYTTFNKDGGDDDSSTASRGNWWQGSLYY